MKEKELRIRTDVFEILLEDAEDDSWGGASQMLFHSILTFFFGDCWVSNYLWIERFYLKLDFVQYTIWLGFDSKFVLDMDRLTCLIPVNIKMI